MFVNDLLSRYCLTGNTGSQGGITSQAQGEEGGSCDYFPPPCPPDIYSCPPQNPPCPPFYGGGGVPHGLPYPGYQYNYDYRYTNNPPSYQYQYNYNYGGGHGAPGGFPGGFPGYPGGFCLPQPHMPWRPISFSQPVYQQNNFIGLPIGYSDNNSCSPAGWPKAPVNIDSFA